MLKKNNIKFGNSIGFTLIEVLVSMVLFSIAIMSLIPFLITNIRYNEMNQIRTAGQKLVEDTAAEIKSIDFYKFDPSINTLKSNLNSIGFDDNLSLISSAGYPASGDVSQPCPTDYEARLYKTDEITKNIIVDNTTKSLDYRFTIKLCVDVDYMEPYLKRAILTCYWNYKNKTHKTTTEVFIAPKG